MGNCIYTNFTFNKYSNQFLNYNIIDKKHNIIVGTYFDTNESKKSNTMINQGICIGYNNNKISKIKLGIMHCIDNKRIELYFE